MWNFAWFILKLNSSKKNWYEEVTTSITNTIAMFRISLSMFNKIYKQVNNTNALGLYAPFFVVDHINRVTTSHFSVQWTVGQTHIYIQTKQHQINIINLYIFFTHQVCDSKSHLRKAQFVFSFANYVGTGSNEQSRSHLWRSCFDNPPYSSRFIYYPVESDIAESILIWYLNFESFDKPVYCLLAFRIWFLCQTFLCSSYF